MKRTWVVALALTLGTAAFSPAAVYNLKVVTDASPDYSDLPSLIHSATSQWETAEEKCWAMFYWNHIARRQTTPMQLHGLALTDPIRQFNDYGYTMCSTIAGINCAIWDAMGLKTKYWDISNHTVSEVEYGGRWHMYDNSMSAIYTLCDGQTIAGVAEIGKPGACEASNGQVEPGHIARYHCLMATSPRGFLTGADTIRSLDEEYRCFNPNGLKYRSYFYDWDRGHRYILNLRANEAYTRFYRSLGDEPEYYVPNDGKDPEAANRRYRIRGNGLRTYKPGLGRDTLASSAIQVSNITPLTTGGVAPAHAQEMGELVFKVEGANVITSLRIQARFSRKNPADLNRVSVSASHGLSWKEIWRNDRTGETPLDLRLIDEINGAYDVLVKVSLLGNESAPDAQLLSIAFETTTMLNSKTQPKLLLGKNTVYVGAGEPTESIVFWPELQGDKYKAWIVEETNMTSAASHPGYMGVLHASRPSQEAYVVFKIDAPRDITGFQYGGRLYNRAPGSRIDLLHSLDGGQTWNRTYSLTNTAQPWDVLHDERVESLPSGVRSVLFKYSLSGPNASPAGCSLYSVRMEVNHRPVDPVFTPVEVTFNWSERQAGYELVERSHTEVITQIPQMYTINVGGADHPVVNSLRVSSISTPGARPGYSDGKDSGGQKFISRWVTYGTNLALNRPYTVSVPSNDKWEAGDPDGTKLTDGIAGPPYPGGTAPRYALGWDKGQEPEITVDLGQVKTCGAFRIQLGAGWPWWDALAGEVQDSVEVLSSVDGRDYSSQGRFDFNLRWKDLPANHFWPDEENIRAHLFELILAQPVQARLVRFKITPQRSLTVSEVEVLDGIRYKPFDLRVALPRM